VSLKMLVNFMSILSILLPFCVFCGILLHFVVILVYFPRFGMLHHEKCDNPALHTYIGVF
jgi:hypothetical protein